jgi:hypothetical protein
MQSIKLGFWKMTCWAFVVVFGLTVMVVASIKNPSKAQSEAHLAVMAVDMDYALAAGGDVDSSYSNAKFGGALLIKQIKAASWTSRLFIEYQKVLKERGWVISTSDTNKEVLLCKNGMLARIDSVPSIDASHGVSRSVYGFSMSYSANTFRTCRP